MTKSLSFAFVAFTLSAAISMGGAELRTQASFGSANGTGNWTAQSFRLDDPGFNKSGDALQSSAYLQSISLVKATTNYDETTAGDLWLVVMKDYKDINSVVQKSTNRINVKGLSQETQMTFKFEGGKPLQTSQVYWLRAVLDNGDGKLDAQDTLGGFRLRTGPNTISGGVVGDKHYMIDLDMKISLADTSGSTDSTLVELGGVSVILAD